MKVLIAYATTEGQTRTIAERTAEKVGELGHEAELVDTSRAHQDIHVDAFDAVIAAASVHQDVHQENIQIFASANRDILNAKPTMFLSVSLSAAFAEGRADAQRYIATFIEETGWKPSTSLPVAGALRGGEYDYFQQQILEHVVLKDREVDPEQEHEFTDWKALGEAVEAFLKRS